MGYSKKFIDQNDLIKNNVLNILSSLLLKGRIILIGYLFILIYIFENISIIESVIIKTEYGNIHGYKSDLARVFYGIPYAQSPIGSLRWNDPIPIDKWFPKTIDASKIPPACPQSHCNIHDIRCPKNISEDCLYLNIFMPLEESLIKRSVMIFFPGGNFDTESASIDVYKADHFVNTTNVICVFVQYRLGILGFLATGNDKNDLKGNYGIIDQQLSIQWIKSNIDAFGGDSNKITLFGQSAGGQSVAIHYLTKKMQSFFQSAIIQSAPLGIPFRTYKEYKLITNILAKKLNCIYNIIDCLRALSYKKLIKAQKEINMMMVSSSFLQYFEPWLPVIDNITVDGQLIETISKRTFSLKPLIIGTMTEEGRSYVYKYFPYPLTSSFYSIIGRIFFGKKFTQIEKHFPIDKLNNDDQRRVVTRLITEWVFTCPTRIFARHTPSHSYIFGYPLNTRNMIDIPDCDGHACHGYELPFLFQAFWTIFNNEERYISKTMADYWTNFAKSKDPNIPVNVSLEWPNMINNHEKYLYFQNPIRIKENFAKYDCDFWDKFGYFYT